MTSAGDRYAPVQDDQRPDRAALQEGKGRRGRAREGKPSKVYSLESYLKLWEPAARLIDRGLKQRGLFCIAP